MFDIKEMSNHKQTLMAISEKKINAMRWFALR